VRILTNNHSTITTRMPSYRIPSGLAAHRRLPAYNRTMVLSISTSAQHLRQVENSKAKYKMQPCVLMQEQKNNTLWGSCAGVMLCSYIYWIKIQLMCGLLFCVSPAQSFGGLPNTWDARLEYDITPYAEIILIQRSTRLTRDLQCGSNVSLLHWYGFSHARINLVYPQSRWWYAQGCR